MKAVIPLLLTVASAWKQEYTLKDIQNIDTWVTFKEWAQFFNRTYGTFAAEQDKYNIWLDNLEIIGQTNSMNKSYKFGLNQFSDMTPDEFSHYVHGDDGSCLKTSQQQIENIDLLVLGDGAPTSVDWTTKGVVTPVKNQGACGSCWAFASTGALECNYAIQKGKLTSLSEQQLVDCAGSAGCAGCNGCSNEQAFNYVKSSGGLCSESEYAYTAKNGLCKASTCGTKYDGNNGYNKLSQNSEPAFVNGVADGCVAIGIEADQTAFQHYSSGVLTGTCGCSVDHAVLIVGYGTSGSQDYWKVKNSWGNTWGMGGYIDICRNCNKNNGAGECCILRDGSVPTFP